METILERSYLLTHTRSETYHDAFAQASMVGKWPQRLVELLNDSAAGFLQWRDNGVGGCHVLITDLDAYKAAFKYSSDNTAWRQQFTAYMFKSIPFGPYHSEESTGYEYEHPALTERLTNAQCYLLKRKPEINARTNVSRKRGSDDDTAAVDALTLFNEQQQPKRKRGRPRKSSTTTSDPVHTCTDLVVADRQQQHQQEQQMVPDYAQNLSQPPQQYEQQQMVPEYALNLTEPQQQYEQQQMMPEYALNLTQPQQEQQQQQLILPDGAVHYTQQQLAPDYALNLTPSHAEEQYENLQVLQTVRKNSFEMIEVHGCDTIVTEQQQEEQEPSFTVDDLYDDSQPFTDREVDQFEKMVHDDHDDDPDTVPSWIEQTEVDMILRQTTSGFVL